MAVIGVFTILESIILALNRESIGQGHVTNESPNLDQKYRVLTWRIDVISFYKISYPILFYGSRINFLSEESQIMEFLMKYIIYPDFWREVASLLLIYNEIFLNFDLYHNP